MIIPACFSISRRSIARLFPYASLSFARFSFPLGQLPCALVVSSTRCWVLVEDAKWSGRVSPLQRSLWEITLAFVGLLSADQIISPPPRDSLGFHKSASHQNARATGMPFYCCQIANATFIPIALADRLLTIMRSLSNDLQV